MVGRGSSIRFVLKLLAPGLLMMACEFPEEMPMPMPKHDRGPRAPFDEPLTKPDLGVPHCGDNICQPEENLTTCWEDCAPQRSRPPPLRPDPGWIDPAPPGP